MQMSVSGTWRLVATGKATLEKWNPGINLRSADVHSHVKASVFHLLLPVFTALKQTLKYTIDCFLPF